MRFYKRVSFRIWFYFSLALTLVFGGASYYYTDQQRNLIIESRGRELKEFCRTIAIGVEISLDLQNFNKLRKAVDNFNERGKEFDFLLLSQQSESGAETLFTHVSADSAFQPGQLDSSLYLIRYQSYSSPTMSGRVICGMAKSRIDEQVSSINQPILLTFLLIFMLSFVLFYFLAQGLTRPVSRAIENAHLLGQNKFNDFKISKLRRTDEIGLLEDALFTLRGSLVEQREANSRLINNLENEVSRRTASLNDAFKKLSEAQEIARLSAFTWKEGQKEWSVSSNMNQILCIEPGIAITFDLLNQYVDVEFRSLLSDLFEKARHKQVQQSVRFRPPNAEALWLNINCAFNIDKDVGYFSGSIQDITIQKEAEEEMSRLSLLATNTTNMVIFTDKEERITWVNDSVERLTGYSREELIGKTPRIFQSEKTRKAEKYRISEAIRQHKPIKAEVLNRGRYGNEYWLELYIQPVFDKAGELSGYMAIEIDITERKITEERLRNYVTEIEEKQSIINSINSNLEKLVQEKTHDLEQSMDRLKNSQDELVRKEKMATLGMLAAGIAHEVNTPLGAIKASSENLFYTLDENLRRYFGLLDNSEVQMAFEISERGSVSVRLTTKQEREIVHRLQAELEKVYLPEYAIGLARTLAQLRFEDTASLPEGFFKLAPERMKLIMEMSSSLFSLKLSVANIETAVTRASKIIRALNVYSHGEASAPHAPFDLRDSLNAVADLLSNKLKQGAVFINHIPAGTLALGQEDELSQVWTNLLNNALQASNNKCKIQVHALAGLDGMIKVQVENDGPPIPPEILNRIFEEFFTTKKRGEGTGLGLSIVSRIIERHGGKISCSSQPGSTIFEVTIPAVSA
jgi:PAS domain S-box-containing protein